MLYCVSVRIAAHRHDEWLEWMRETHIPDVLATGCFRGAWLLRPEDGEPGEYRMHYDAKDADALRRYQRDLAPALQTEHTQRFAGDFDASREILGVIARFPT